jgi:tRNA (mo5U34)-methyltransferase
MRRRLASSMAADGMTHRMERSAAVPAELRERARSLTWYHTLELGPDLVTEGWFDLRPYVPRYGLPERMEGMRALDVGTWDGFWAFEMERRGAQVVALDLDDERDLDWPPRRRPPRFADTPRGEGFRLAREILGSSVERVNASIYDAAPADLGTFDVVLCGSVLIHLRDQLLALERIAGLTKPGGMFVSAEEYDRRTGLLPFPAARYRGADAEPAIVFWTPNRRAWERLLWSAGFDRVERRGRFSLRSREGWSVPHHVLHGHRAA